MGNKCFSLISMLVSLIIILILYYFFFHIYLGKSLLSRRTEKTLRRSNINVSNPASIIHKAKSVVNSVNKEVLKENKQINSIFK